MKRLILKRMAMMMRMITLLLQRACNLQKESDTPKLVLSHMLGLLHDARHLII